MARKPRSSSATAEAKGAAPPAPILIVGIAASGPTLPSLERLFSHGPIHAGVATVVSLRQSDGVDAATVVGILARRGLAACIATDGAPAAPDQVYVAPTDRLMTLEAGRFRLAQVEQPPGERAAIDSFLISLAEDARERAVAVILAGMGSVGTAGITAAKEHGGLAIAELDAERPDLGISLIDPAGLVDFVLPIDDIAARIAVYAGHLARLEAVGGIEAERAAAGEQLARISGILRSRTGHDFHGYKHNTFMRRVQRRMQVLQIDQVEAYVEHLRNTPDEVGHLFQDLLIGVTQFFRDGLEFDLLCREVIPKLVVDREGDQARIWVLGCATGEEAYSIAILMQEQMAKLDRPPTVQIFATDIDGRALTMARSGRYPESIAKDVTPERLARWFSKEGTTYAVIKELREMCIFSQHNVVRDAPFSRIDLVSCRNLLIYLTSELQDRVIPLFHFALKPGGFLFLGPSENVTRHAKLFAPIDRRHRIYRRLETVTRILPEFPLAAGDRARVSLERAQGAIRPRPEANIGRRAERIADRYAPAYVLVDDQYEVLHFSGRTGRFLEPAAGAASLNLLNLVHRDLRVDLRAALHSATADKAVAKVERLQVGLEGEIRRVDLVVEPVIAPDAPLSFVVLFRDGGPVSEQDSEQALQAPAMRDEHVQRLEAELRLTKERLQATIEELESTNEELKSSNEEYQSINEEMQSANEELETSKEELQSVNEELQTVNGELAHRVSDLGRANSDLKNLLESTQIATVFLDNELRIKSFTPAVADLFHLIDVDLGRPITHIAGRIAYPELADDVKKVLRNLTPIERAVVDPEAGSRYLVRVLPYRSIDNYISGAVITFLDVTATVRAEAEAAEAGAKTRAILESITDAFYALDGQMRFTYVNARALQDWNKRAEDVLGRELVEVFPDAATTEAFEAQRRAVKEGRPVHIEARSPVLAQWIAISAYPDVSGGASVYFRDISERKQSEERQNLLMGELQHRVKNILAVVRSIANRTLESSENLEEFAAHFEGRLRAMARTQGVLTRQATAVVDLEEIVREELLSHAIQVDGQVEVEGPPVSLKQKQAETMALALHELTTNAVKYGALATSAGRLTVSWRIMNASDGARLSLHWSEAGVALINPDPSHTGFGRELIERGLPYDLGAATALEFAPGGVRCTIELPLPAEANDDEAVGSVQGRGA